MWQRFTERARRVIFYAQQEAGSLGGNFVTSEHILLALTREENTTALIALKSFDIGPATLREELEKQITCGSGSPGEDMQLAPSAKHCIDLAYEEARRLNNDYIGTEHLLLGLLAEREGLAARVLMNMGVQLEPLRLKVQSLQAESINLMNGKEESIFEKSLSGRDILSINDLSTEEIWMVFRIAQKLKKMSLKQQAENPVLPGQTLAMIFEKPSLRTRVTFETGMQQLGGYAIFLQPSDIRMGERESVKDIAQNLDRWVQGIMARVFDHQTVVDLAKYSRVPVINGLSDLEHPCQALADFLTIHEHKGELKGLKLAYIGDGCNTCNSLMLLAAKVGTNMSVGCPKGYEPDAKVLADARTIAQETGATITIVNDPFEAVEGADAIYTDIWCSMGMEAEKEERMPIFQPYQVNQKMVDTAKKDAIILHCLPAHRGEEITDEVLDGPQSVVLDEAENRLHAQKALLALIM